MILDIVVSILLFTTIVYCWRLSKKIATLRENRKELEIFLKEFNDSINRASVSIATLKTLTQDADGKLKDKIDKARFLANDLSFLSYKGSGVADKLEGFIASSRTVDPNPMGLKGSGQSTHTKQKSLGHEHQNKEGTPPHWKFPEKNVSPQKNVNSSDSSLTRKQAIENVLEQIAAKRIKRDTPEAKEVIRAGETMTPRVLRANVRRDEAVPERDIGHVKRSVETLKASLKIDT
jgi:hypothetical protein